MAAARKSYAQFLRVGGLQEPVSMSSESAAPEALMRDAGKLMVEAGSVIALRTVRIGQGDPGAGDEMMRMVTEKVWAGWEWSMALASGQLGHDPGTVCSRTLTYYRRAVRANLNRLSSNDE